MITDSSIEIEAPAGLVWDVFVDVEKWPEWTESVRQVVALDGSDLAIGRRFKISQPRMPTLVWTVTDLDPGRSWTWRQTSPGGTTTATHVVTAEGDARTLVQQRIEQRGPIGVLVGRMMRGLTRRYLDMEGQGLKARSEARCRRDGATR